MAKKHTRFLSLLITAVVLVCLLATTAFAAETPVVFSERPICYIHGNVNNDNALTAQDAIYVLYNYMFPDENPVVHQSVDYNGDGMVDTKDAIYLLYAANFDEGDGLGDKDNNRYLMGDVHEFYTPYFVWTPDPSNPAAATAQLVIRCGCGEIAKTVDATLGTPAVTNPTCTDNGQVLIHATATYAYEAAVDGEIKTFSVTYTTDAANTDGYTVVNEPYSAVIPYTGHSIGEPTCSQAAVCANGCGYTIPATGAHNWGDGIITREATCTQGSQQTFNCVACGETKNVELDDKVPHDFQYVEGADRLVDGSACEWVRTYACAYNCGTTTEGEHYEIHTFVPGAVTEATCTSAGKQIFNCSVDGCDGYKEEPIPQNTDAHNWAAGETVEGVTTHTCGYCGTTKTTVAATNGSEVDKATLAANELTLNDAEGNALASINLGAEALAGAADEAKVAISVDEADKNALSVDADTLAQIGDNTVYDFTLTVDNVETSSFGADITISLPYELQEGDDVDAIDVWFIDDSGNVTIVQGKYANGMVTFTTNHFSYYTVTRLTPAQRCEFYGHVQTEFKQAPTCTAGGYIKLVCGRCGIDIPGAEITNLDSLGHNFVESGSKAPTCTDYGYKQEKCDRCSHIRQENLMPLGHDMQLNEAESCGSTCVTAGKVVFTCVNNCGATKTTVLDLAEHTYGAPEQIYPTCTEAGYTREVCTVVGCGFERITNKLDPLGHDYAADKWTWKDDMSSASLLIVCKNDHSHDQNVKANMRHDTEAATCTSAGHVTHTASLYFNNKHYEDIKFNELEKNDHKPHGGWFNNSNEHYRECEVCSEQIDAAEHQWNSGVVTAEATCISNGSKTYTCLICDRTKTESLPATGVHNLVDGTCSVCQFTENTCKHDRLYSRTLDTASYGICPMTLTIVSCDCGQVYSHRYPVSECNFVESGTVDKVMSDGTTQKVTVATCSECGLVNEYFYHAEYVNEDSCTGYYKDYDKLSINGTVISEYLNRDSHEFKHPLSSVVETEDLAALGFCGGQLVTRSCSCGKIVSTGIENSACNWEYDSSTGHDICNTCGISYTSNNSVEDTENCHQYTRVDCVYYKDGEEILTCVRRYGSPVHETYVKDYVINGSVCDDGVTMHYVCRNCDYEQYTHITMHFREVHEETDLTGFNSCDTKLHLGRCACGQYGTYTLDGNHSWTVTSENEETRTTVSTCSTCGITKTEVVTSSEMDENCGYYDYTTATYTNASGNSYVTRSEAWRNGHKYVTKYEMNGSSCLDGVTVKLACTNCGLVTDSQTFTDAHAPKTTETYDLTKFGACGGEAIVITCVCGQHVQHNYMPACNWVYDYESISQNYQKATCSVCGVTREYIYEHLATIDDCHDRVRISFLFSKDGQPTGDYSYVTYVNTHRFTYELALMEGATDCYGGYTAEGTCVDCGEKDYINSNDMGVTQYGCEYSHITAREIVSVNQLCGDLELAEVSCACGKNSTTQDIWSNGNCNFQWSHYDYDSEIQTEYHTLVCTRCGAIREETYKWTPIAGETCRQNVAGHVKITSKSGQTACDYDWNSIGYSHDPVSSFELLDPAQGCDGGYRTYSTCRACGATVENGEWVNYGCESRIINSTVVLEHDGLCSPVYLHESGCACGAERYTYTYCDCSMSWYWDDALQCGVDSCSDCGLKRYSYGNHEQISGTCTANNHIDEVYELNGTIIGSYEGSFVVTSHMEVVSFNMQGQSCEDGYTVTRTCAVCDRANHSEMVQYHHSEEMIAYYDFAEYGMCGGAYYVWGCGCGKNSSTGWNYFCNWQSTEDQDENGYTIFYCADCDTYRSEGHIGTHDEPNCKFVGTHYVKLIRDNTVLLEINTPVSENWHTWRTISANLHNPDSDCTNGVTINMQCRYCGQTDSHPEYVHAHIEQYRFDLSDGCGGELVFGCCACGKETFFHQGMDCQSMSHIEKTVTDDNGVQHHYVERVCPDCGLSITFDMYSTKDETTCLLIDHEVSTVTYNGETYSFDNQRQRYDHDYEFTGAQLHTPGTSCTDGVDVSWTCRTCNLSGSIEGYNDHALVLNDEINLADYGAVCGSSLGQYVCPCGAKERYDFTGNSNCDVDWQRMDQSALETWIPGVLNNEQWTTEEYYRTKSNGYILVCAVTHDANGSNPCGLKIRVAEYYLNENCAAVEYQRWQLGYDETDGSCARDITVKTGEQHTYHNYEMTFQNTPYADGSYVDEQWATCSDCQSYELYRNTFDANNIQTKHEWIRENTLNNGQTKKITMTDIYDLTYGNYRYASSTTTDYIYADDTTYWEKTSFSNYIFNAPERCLRTAVYTNQKGETGEPYQTDACIHPCKDTVTKQATCSQPGEKVHEHICPVCSSKNYEEIQIIEPHHEWSEQSDGSGFYCTVCGLESELGSSGNIVMEDLTVDTESVYTIGYFVKQEVHFTPTVSVILNDLTEGNNELILANDENIFGFTYLTIPNDGICALTFSKAAVQDAAVDAMNAQNYQGSYAIRITFVPLGSTANTDCAITFDSQSHVQEGA